MEYLNKKGKLFHYYDKDDNDKNNGFSVDELIVPIVYELNRKNYTTSYSCSSHFSENCRNAYIAFEPWVRIPSIPKGWKYEENFPLIRFYPADHNDYDKENMDNYYNYYLYLITIFYETHEWAKSLPEFHLGKEERELKIFFNNIIKDTTLEKYIWEYKKNNGIPRMTCLDFDGTMDEVKECIHTKFKTMKNVHYFMDSYDVVLRCLAENLVKGNFHDYNDVVDYLERL